MNKIKLFFLLIAVFFFAPSLSFSQSASSQIPAFKINLTNGKTFSTSQISKKPLIIIYFAPDCEHCQVLMDELFKKINDFKTAQIMMVTFQPVTELAGFEKKYHTAKYANIKVGTETPVFFLRNYYRVERTPFAALFDKHGKLVVSYKQQTPVPELIKRLKALK